MQVSLAADDSQEHLGTGFYRRSFAPSAWMREPRGFEVAKRMSFSPNAAYGFVVLNTLTKRSWHGRETLDGDSGVRNSILHIYYAKRHHANADIVREQYGDSISQGRRVDFACSTIATRFNRETVRSVRRRRVRNDLRA